MARDDFSPSIKDVLGKRVALRCSNPGCGVVTSGPHSNSSRAVNLGVAAHIAAASPGGPRFDEAQSAEERSSIENAIWLCQGCAKLVDSDVARFSATLLKSWKVDAEAQVMRALGAAQEDVYSQPASSQHTPLPRIDGLPLAAARDRLIRAGWQPMLNHWSYAGDVRIQSGNGPWLWERGFHEVTDASGTGLAYCILKYRDAYGNQLKLVTAGEPAGDDGDVLVWSWSIQTHDRLMAAERELSRLSTQITHAIEHAIERTHDASRARRDLAISAGASGRSREKLYRVETEGRLRKLTAAANRLKVFTSDTDSLDEYWALKSLDALLAEVTAISERSREDKEHFDAERSRLALK